MLLSLSLIFALLESPQIGSKDALGLLHDVSQRYANAKAT